MKCNLCNKEGEIRSDIRCSFPVCQQHYETFKKAEEKSDSFFERFKECSASEVETNRYVYTEPYIVRTSH